MGRDAKNCEKVSWGMVSWAHRLPSRIFHWFSAPPPSLLALALFRLGLGLLVLCDVVGRWKTADLFLSCDGLLPVGLQSPERVSVFGWFGNAEWWARSLLAVYGLAGLCLLIGFRTRTAALLGWFLILSLHHRNPYVTNGGDFLLRLLLLWSCFFPSGRGFPSMLFGIPGKRFDTLRPSPIIPRSDTLAERALQFVGLNQRWTMYCDPPSESSRIAVVTRVGPKRIDLLSMDWTGAGSLDLGPFALPAGGDRFYENARWSNFLHTLAHKNFPKVSAPTVIAERLGRHFSAKFPDLVSHGWQVVLFTRTEEVGEDSPALPLGAADAEETLFQVSP